MKFIDRMNAGLDRATQFLYLAIECVFRMVALMSLPALVVWVVLSSANFLLGGVIFREAAWLFPAMTVVQIIGLDSNIICLLADAALDQLPHVFSERALRLWRIRQLVRSVTIALAGAAVILPLVLLDSSPIWPGNGPIPAWLEILRTIASVAVVVLNVVLSPLVRRRVQAEMFSLGMIVTQETQAGVAEGEQE